MIESILIISFISLMVSLYTLWHYLPRTQKKQRSVLLDTSALIDGRISEVVKSGFVPEQLLVPRFVIAELQLLADKADHIKRERARYGLQVIQDLQNSRHGNVTIIGSDIPSESGVDEKLVKLALKLNALLFTTDYNLLKVAEIEGVRVLNVNELAQSLRPTHIPGEKAEIKIIGKGQERTQGVGYLEDGSMVVIEKAGSKIGQKLTVEFTRTLQTAAGRMMFAKALLPAKREVPQQPTNTRSSTQKRTTRPARKLSAEEKLLAAIENK